MSDWYAIYTKSRFELKVAERLEEKGIEIYCPTQTVVRQWSDRKKKVTVPLFRSYVFVKHNNEQERIAILQTYGVVNFVRYLGKEAVIRAIEIEAIKELLGDYGNIEVKDITEGDLVTIKQGALKGQNGIIKSTDGKKAVLILDNLGVSLTAEIKNINLSKLKDGKTLKDEQQSKYHL